MNMKLDWSMTALHRLQKVAQLGLALEIRSCLLLK